MSDPTTAVPDGDFSLALAAVEEELERIELRDLIAVNIDVSAAAIVALGVAPKLAQHRPAMVEWFGEEMARKADRLEEVARAAWQAHSEYTSLVSGAAIAPLAAAVVEERAVLLADVQALVARKLVSAEVLDGLSGTHGFKNLCFDLLHLVAVLRREHEIVEQHTRLTRADLNRCQAVANRLATAVGVRDQAGTSPAALLRQRAFTHFVRSYNQIRRMLAFLRFDEGDAELIAPSLWVGRGGRKRKAIAESDPGVAGIAPPTVTVAPGMPGGSPFVDA